MVALCSAAQLFEAKIRKTKVVKILFSETGKFADNFNEAYFVKTQ